MCSKVLVNYTDEQCERTSDCAEDVAFAAQFIYVSSIWIYVMTRVSILMSSYVAKTSILLLNQILLYLTEI